MCAVIWGCHADPAMFLPWEKLPEEFIQEITANGSIPCEGGGLPGEWCGGCRFGEELDRNHDPDI